VVTVCDGGGVALARCRYTVCGGCLELVPSDDYHRSDTCTKMKKRLEGQRYVHYVLQEQLSQRARQRLRFAIGGEVCTNSEFVEKRDQLWADIAAISPFHLDPFDETSVWSTYDSTLEWMVQVEHIARLLPAFHECLCIILTNDGTPQLGRLSNRAAHAMLMRLNLGADAACDASTVGVNALFGSGESATTYDRMFRRIKEYHDSFKKLGLTARLLGWKQSKVLICVDGAAMVLAAFPRACCAIFITMKANCAVFV